MATDLKPATMSENARTAAAMIAKEQQKRKGRKVRVVATAEGFDGFKLRQEGEHFVAWWVDGTKKPSWQMEEKEWEKKQAAAEKDEEDAEDIGE